MAKISIIPHGYYDNRGSARRVPLCHIAKVGRRYVPKWLRYESYATLLIVRKSPSIGNVSMCSTSSTLSRLFLVGCFNQQTCVSSQHLVFGSRTGYALSRDVSPSMRSEPSSFHDLGSRVTAEGSRRSKIIDRASVSARTRHLLGLLLPHHQLELVALRVGERGLRHTKRHTARADRRELDLVERPRAQAGQPLHLLVLPLAHQHTMDAVL